MNIKTLISIGIGVLLFYILYKYWKKKSDESNNPLVMISRIKTGHKITITLSKSSTISQETEPYFTIQRDYNAFHRFEGKVIEWVQDGYSRILAVRLKDLTSLEITTYRFSYDSLKNIEVSQNPI